MSLAPLLTADPIIQVHATCAILAVSLGPVALYRQRRDRLHRIIGYVWVLAMALTALSSFGITGFGVIGPFSPIHLLSLLVLWSLWVSISQVRRGDLRAHAATMRNLYWRGLAIAGLLTFLPGRTVNRIFFADVPEGGLFVIALGALALIAQILRAQGPRRRHA